jgi:hypothetical protein
VAAPADGDGDARALIGVAGPRARSDAACARGPILFSFAVAAPRIDAAPRRCLMAKGQVNKNKSNKPKLTAKQKQAKRAEKRATKNG